MQTNETPTVTKTDLKRDQVNRVIIIGSGPAGLTAALYTARANLNPIVFEGDGFYETMPGGQLMITTEVENFPGFVKWQDGKLHGMMGPEVMDILRNQAKHFGAQCVQKRVTAIDFTSRPLTVEVDGEKHYAESVIVSTGATAKWLDVPGEEEYKSYGVTACATCDGAFYKDKDVLVVGGGDTAMEEALYLTKHCRTVTLVHRRDSFRASKIMADRALAHPKITVMWNSAISEVLGKQEGMKKAIYGARVKDTVTGEEREITTDGIFVAIGHKPNTDLFKGVLDMEDSGYLVTAPKSTYTNLPGVFACGDCQDHVYRQAITAAGTGCMAAIDAERYIESNHVEFAS